MTKKKALVYNFLAALSAVLGAAVGLLFHSDSFSAFIIPFTAGAFIYIAASNLIPELHKERDPAHTVLQLLGTAAGIALMVAIALYGPAHAH
jgi:zinc and cadmium transporter